MPNKVACHKANAARKTDYCEPNGLSLKCDSGSMKLSARTQDQSSRRRTRIAIIGGGPAALAAAFSLTSNEPDAYEITIYEMSWRLGGKTASGRDQHGRIEEHGLHILFGCYHNVFRMLRMCYAEMREKRLASPEQHEFQYFFDAIKPGHVGVIGDDRYDRWQAIHLQFPSNRGVPGEPPLPSSWNLAITAFQIGWIIVLGPQSLGHVQRKFGSVFDYSNRWKRKRPGEAAYEETHPIDHEDGKDLGGDRASRAFLKLTKNMLDGKTRVGKACLRLLKSGHARWRGARSIIKPIVSRFESVYDHPPFSRLWSGVDFLFALFRGLIEDRVLVQPGGFETIDGMDFREWLLHHEAGPSTLGSPWMRVIYDAAFSYPKGGKASPGESRPPWLQPNGLIEDVAAGAALRALLLMTITYKGCFYNKMEAGMGDVVHTPLYLVLKHRGVHFKFFHRLEDVIPAHDGDGRFVVKELVFDALAQEEQEYYPLVPVDRLLCWPSTPKLDEIDPSGHRRAREAESYACVPGRKLSVKRREDSKTASDSDFDAVVLGIPVECLPFACRSLLAAERERGDRPDASLLNQTEIGTVQTIAMQLWMKPSLVELGWHDPPPLLSLFVDPLNTWCDMSHLIEREAWAPGGAPRTVAYFCGPLMHEHAFPAPATLASNRDLATQVHERIVEQSRLAAFDLLDQHLNELMPTVRASNGFNYALLVDKDNRKGNARFDAQFLRANYEPHQLCTLALKQKTKFRMKTDETGYDNLFVTGDWIDNGVYLACVEGAVHSGLRTARAISQKYGTHPEKYSIAAEELLNLQVLTPC